MKTNSSSVLTLSESSCLLGEQKSMFIITLVYWLMFYVRASFIRNITEVLLFAFDNPINVTRLR